jgi:branched-subunit amino acid transport protein
MTAAWTVVVLTGAATIVLKGLGPAVLGGRPLPDRLLGPLTLLAPALLAALVATQVFGGDRRLVIDARAVGVAVAAIAIWRRAPLLLVVVLAAVATAIVRAL